MSAVSLALPGAALQARTSDQSGAGAGEQQVQKQQREQDEAGSQRRSAQLRQLFVHQAVSSAVANSQAADAGFEGAVSSARAAASAALLSSTAALSAHPRNESNGNLGLLNAASVVAGARASINAAKLVALRESQHGDLADLVQLDQQAANAQGAIDLLV